MAVVSDIIDGAGGSKDYLGWKEITRKYTINGITSTSFQAKADEAIAAAGVSIGDPHPSVPDCYLTEISPKLAGGDVMELVCTYKREQYTLDRDDDVEVGASAQSVETNKDINDNEMFLSYTYPVGYKRSPHDDALTAEETKTVGHTTSRMTPQGTFRKCKIKSISASQLQDLADEYVGTINSAAWNGKPAQTYLCTGIMGRSKDAGKTFVIYFEFQYQKETWKHTAIFIKDDGTPPYPTDSNSKKTYNIYPEKNFSLLAIL